MRKIKILSTKNLDQDLKNLFNKNKYELWEHDFIKIETTDFTFPNHDESWIFFSKNSVKSIFSNKTAKNFSFKRIYCVGGNTKSLLSKYGQSVFKSYNSSAELANYIINFSNKEKFILCRGNLKNEDFSESFDSNNIDLKELVVYKNLSNSKTINEEFDSIMFYSPSGIKSFLENNNINDSNCICIRKTTAKFAAMHSSKVLFCQTPTIKNVIEKTIKLYDE